MAFIQAESSGVAMTAAQAKPQIVQSIPLPPHPAIDYLEGTFREGDHIFFVLIHSWKTHPNPKTGDSELDIKVLELMPLTVATRTKTIARLGKYQENDWNVYVSMNPFPVGSHSRTESFIKTIRNVFIETDEGDVLPTIALAVADSVIPAPHSILQSSPGKFHIVWHTDGFTPEEAKALNRALASRFGGDPACVDLHRLLRMPGFKNLKYADKPICALVEPMNGDEPYTREQFKIETKVLKANGAPVSEGILNNIIASVEKNATEANFTLGPREKDLNDYRWDITCPWADGHSRGSKSAIIMVLKDGRIEFSCLHYHCVERGWSDIRQLWETAAGHKQKFAAVKELQEMILSKDGGIKALVANAIQMLATHPAWQGVLAYNELTLFPVKLKPTPWDTTGDWNDHDDTKLAEWFQRQGLFIDSSKKAGEAAQAVAQMNRFHPVRDYLNSLTWDKTARLDALLPTYFGVNVGKDVSESALKYILAVGRCWMLSAVARALNPGCKVDCVLLLQAGQGRKKSQALEALASKGFFSDHMPDLGNKDALLEAHRIWIMELAELASIRGKENERVKAFLSRFNDLFRAPYDRRVQEHLRGFVFAGTTNDDTPFTDETGNRRYWPVQCGDINIEKLRKDRDQLWAEAVARFNNKERWWLDAETEKAAEQEQYQRYQSGQWDNIIETWLANPEPSAQYGSLSDVIKIPGLWSSTTDEVTIDDILLHAIGKPRDKWSQPDKNSVAKYLVSKHWVRVNKWIGGTTKRVYRRSK